MSGTLAVDGMSGQYDLCVAYRIYPLVSKTPPAYADDKLKLSELCLRSFRRSLGSLRVKMFVLLDNCGPEYGDLFDRYFSPDDLVKMPLGGIGNRETFAMQVRLLSEQQYSDIVYFAEDDYYYRPGQFARAIRFMRSRADADFVTPYDHPDYYRMKIHEGDYRVAFESGQHWRTAASTCLTFLARRQALRETQEIFLSYGRGNSDLGMWLGITRHKLLSRSSGFTWRYCWKQLLSGRRRSLWVPVPSIATHMEADNLAPTMDSIDFAREQS